MTSEKSAASPKIDGPTAWQPVSLWVYYSA